MMTKGWTQESTRHSLASKGIKTSRRGKVIKPTARELTITDVKRINVEKGQYFFSPDTMKFFNSRVESKLYNDKYFITSEKSPHDDRKYTIRKFNKKTGNIGTVGEFQGYSSKVDARVKIEGLK